ncbi:hypothetical protein [Tateyamaria sp. ANG-S1]|uniref:hypothetical protein n=1 Tax=Tateyamaria sp. ANG-S1 TaxID=1577905 RepID=UPI00057DD45A|nr:hypothetical protein [Tateyamaria sp. ANG-S1]KIC44895.1 hypothetical protein RA29_21225 [Tateyamaria sp. ANG-S1]
MRLPLIALCSIVAAPAFADYSLELTEIGKRDYYCTITVALTNNSDTTLTEINAFFLNHIGEEQVGRSKGASFMNVAPGASASATFETPNAPCSATDTDVESYQMVIGACRIDNAFEDKTVCVDRMTLTDPFSSATALN